MDTVSVEKRSYIMSRIRSKDTGPEMVVRRALHGMGCRYRLHRRDLPGNPDIVMPGRRLAIFVHGCFWHQHRKCRGSRIPKSNVEFWRAKLERNVKRDRKAVRDLRAMGWDVKVVWECEIPKDVGEAAEKLRRELEL